MRLSSSSGSAPRSSVAPLSWRSPGSRWTATSASPRPMARASRPRATLACSPIWCAADADRPFSTPRRRSTRTPGPALRARSEKSQRGTAAATARSSRATRWPSSVSSSSSRAASRAIFAPWYATAPPTRTPATGSAIVTPRPWPPAMPAKAATELQASLRWWNAFATKTSDRSASPTARVLRKSHSFATIETVATDPHVATAYSSRASAGSNADPAAWCAAPAPAATRQPPTTAEPPASNLPWPNGWSASGGRRAAA
mmetsp:Transcript_28714/g.97823  ORF Transcript_28714/g.97823 Transcript_28714/m.97823 type:complete len:258 (-) Transcript_28714:290-1063(-)